MTQPTFEDGPPVPLMVEGLIDAPTLHQLCADLAASAVVTTVREKGGPTATSGEPLALDAARDRLIAGACRAIQVGYSFDGHDWTDTIFAGPTGFRVVRCRHEK